MDEPPKLAELHSADLDEATLTRLFEDLAGHAQVLEITLKAAAAQYAAAERVSLAAAQAALAQRGVRGAQIRYRWQGEIWCDTLLVTPAGWRIVRQREPGV